MARNYFVNGNTMVYANGAELGLSNSQISITLNPRHLDIQVSTFGPDVPPEIQAMLADATISMTLVNFDAAVLQACVRRSMACSADGVMPSAGVLMGAASMFTSLNISSPVGQVPWTFPSAYLVAPAVDWPLGNERSIVSLNWRAIPFKLDPADAAGAILYTN